MALEEVDERRAGGEDGERRHGRRREPAAEALVALLLGPEHAAELPERPHHGSDYRARGGRGLREQEAERAREPPRPRALVMRGPLDEVAEPIRAGALRLEQRR